MHPLGATATTPRKSRSQGSGFEKHGLNDSNVQPKQFSQLWAEAQRPEESVAVGRGSRRPVDYPRGAWLGHAAQVVRPLAIRNATTTFMTRRRRTIEREPDPVWRTQAGWAPASTRSNAFLAGHQPGSARRDQLASGGATGHRHVQGWLHETPTNGLPRRRSSPPDGSQGPTRGVLTRAAQSRHAPSRASRTSTFRIERQATENIGACGRHNCAVRQDQNRRPRRVQNDRSSAEGWRRRMSTQADSSCYYA